MTKQPADKQEENVMNAEILEEMTRPTSEQALAKAVRFQGNMMPLGEWIIATRWAWNYETNAMGYHAFLYRYTSHERGENAPIRFKVTSASDFEDFASQAEAGAWAMSMILDH